MKNEVERSKVLNNEKKLTRPLIERVSTVFNKTAFRVVPLLPTLLIKH